jgi:hypothetical protein
MVPTSLLRRLASAGLAVLVLVSSLTCMTVACRVVCAAESVPAVAADTAPSDLPPCHRTSPEGSSTAPAPAGGGCNAGTVCCSTWLQDRDVYRMPAPNLARVPFADDAPALQPATAPVLAPADAFARSLGADPPDPCLALLPSPRASRAPPAA